MATPEEPANPLPVPRQSPQGAVSMPVAMLAKLEVNLQKFRIILYIKVDKTRRQSKSISEKIPMQTFTYSQC